MQSNLLRIAYTVRLPQDLLEQIRALKWKKRMTHTEIIETAIREYIAREDGDTA